VIFRKERAEIRHEQIQNAVFVDVGRCDVRWMRDAGDRPERCVFTRQVGAEHDTLPHIGPEKIEFLVTIQIDQADV
jgi:hypothetical protein